MKDFIKYAAILVGVSAAFRLFGKGKGGGSVPELPTDPSGSGIGFTQQEALAIADRIWYAMADVGTNESLLFNNLENLTANQLIMVYNAFGQRPYAFTGNWFGLGFPLDLFGWFNEELGPQDLMKMKNIWAKTGLTWTLN